MENSYLTLVEAAEKCPKKISPDSVWRWARKGLKSRSGEIICLEHIRVGKKIYLTENALEEFGKKLADSDTKHFDKPKGRSSPKESNRSAHLQAVETLKEMGITF